MSCCVTDYYTGVGDNRPLFSMETELNKEESTETSIFINFSIREYVAEICKKNPEKCWPFGSLHDPDNKVASSYQSPESTLLSGQNFPSNVNSSDDTTELADAPNSSKVENINGKEDRPETATDMISSGKAVNNGSSELTFCKVSDGQIQHEINSVDEGAKIRHNEAAGNNEPGRNRPRRKHKKFRLLADIYKDPASKLRARCDRTKVKNVNRRFVAQNEDESDDDVTLAEYFRKQKGVEVNYSTLNKKRGMGITVVEEPSVDQDKKSNHGYKDLTGKDLNVGTSRKKSRTDDVDSQTMPEKKKDFQLNCSLKSNQFAEISSKEAAETETEKEKEKENEDSEMEAVMLLARRFNEQKQILHTLDTNPTCACAKKKIRGHTTQSGNKPATNTSSKTTTKHRVKKITNKKLKNAFKPVTKRSSKSTTKHGVKKITNKRLENAFCSVQRMSFTQSHIEMNMMKAAAANVCSINRNPADFSIPNGENEFMRGG